MAAGPLRVLDLGRRPFAEIERLQSALRAQVLAGDAAAATLLLVEHEAVVTLGRRAPPDALRISEDALRRAGIALERTSRGGEATYHGPGQLVAYPVVPIPHGVIAHVAALAEAAVVTARAFGVEARYDRARPGLWVGARKLASIGVHVHRRIAVHGLALNVTRASCAGFRHIVPCGMPEVSMTSLEDEGAAGASVAEAAAHFARAFCAARA
jgi:lipoyl synthase